MKKNLKILKTNWINFDQGFGDTRIKNVYFTYKPLNVSFWCKVSEHFRKKHKCTM